MMTVLQLFLKAQVAQGQGAGAKAEIKLGIKFFYICKLVLHT